MIPDDSTLKRFLKAKMNFFVYGPRASGKTFLLKKLFEELKMDYIYINCTMGDKKANFFRYLNHELDKFFKKKLREEQSKSKALKQHYVKLSDPSSVHDWIKNIKDLSPPMRLYLQNIYFFIDNIEQIHVSTNFMTTFFSSCQEAIIDDLKIPFVFCGVTLPKKIYAVDKPFRNIISFCMRKPTTLMKDQIEKTVENVFLKKFTYPQDNKLRKQSIQWAKNASKALSVQIYHAFEPMETDLNKVKKMANVVAGEIAEDIIKQMGQEVQKKIRPRKGDETIDNRIRNKIAKGQIKKYTKDILEQGPVADFLVKRKLQRQVHNEQAQVQLPYEYYPTLIMSGLHLADLAPESDDKRRFQDYKKQKGRATKNIENRIAKHNLQRVLAITEVLESMGKQDGYESQLSHHSLYYYACLEFLREEDRIYFHGKNCSFGSTKVYGDTKQEEVNSFLKTKMGIKYDEFIPK